MRNEADEMFWSASGGKWSRFLCYSLLPAVRSLSSNLIFLFLISVCTDPKHWWGEWNWKLFSEKCLHTGCQYGVLAQCVPFNAHWALFTLGPLIRSLSAVFSGSLSGKHIVKRVAWICGHSYTWLEFLSFLWFASYNATTEWNSKFET